MPKPRFEQYAAQLAGVLLADEVEAEMSARPDEPSAMRLEDAEAKPAGRAAVEPEPPVEPPVEPEPDLGERSALSLVVS
jgi:hypothetical protein